MQQLQLLVISKANDFEELLRERIIRRESPYSIQLFQRIEAINSPFSVAVFAPPLPEDWKEKVKLLKGHPYGPAILFVLRDNTPEELKEIFQAGAEEFIPPQFSRSEFLSKLQILLERQIKKNIGKPNIFLNGDLSSIPPKELIQLFQERKGSATVNISSNAQRGSLFFRKGNLLAAVFEEEQGIDALMKILQLSEGKFSSIPSLPEMVPGIIQEENPLQTALERLKLQQELLKQLPPLHLPIKINFQKVQKKLHLLDEDSENILWQLSSFQIPEKFLETITENKTKVLEKILQLYREQFFTTDLEPEAKSEGVEKKIPLFSDEGFTDFNSKLDEAAKEAAKYLVAAASPSSSFQPALADENPFNTEFTSLDNLYSIDNPFNLQAEPAPVAQVTVPPQAPAPSRTAQQELPISETDERKKTPSPPQPFLPPPPPIEKLESNKLLQKSETYAKKKKERSTNPQFPIITPDMTGELIQENLVPTPKISTSPAPQDYSLSPDTEPAEEPLADTQPQSPLPKVQPPTKTDEPSTDEPSTGGKQPDITPSPQPLPLEEYPTPSDQKEYPTPSDRTETSEQPETSEPPPHTEIKLDEAKTHQDSAQYPHTLPDLTVPTQISTSSDKISTQIDQTFEPQPEEPPQPFESINSTIEPQPEEPPQPFESIDSTVAEPQSEISPSPTQQEHPHTLPDLTVPPQLSDSPDQTENLNDGSLPLTNEPTLTDEIPPHTDEQAPTAESPTLSDELAETSPDGITPPHLEEEHTRGEAKLNEGFEASEKFETQSDQTEEPHRSIAEAQGYESTTDSYPSAEGKELPEVTEETDGLTIDSTPTDSPPPSESQPAAATAPPPSEPQPAADIAELSEEFQSVEETATYQAAEEDRATEEAAPHQSAETAEREDQQPVEKTATYQSAEPNQNDQNTGGESYKPAEEGDIENFVKMDTREILDQLLESELSISQQVQIQPEESFQIQPEESRRQKSTTFELSLELKKSTVKIRDEQPSEEEKLSESKESAERAEKAEKIVEDELAEGSENILEPLREEEFDFPPEDKRKKRELSLSDEFFLDEEFHSKSSLKGVILWGGLGIIFMALGFFGMSLFTDRKLIVSKTTKPSIDREREIQKEKEAYTKLLQKRKQLEAEIFGAADSTPKRRTVQIDKKEPDLQNKEQELRERSEKIAKLEEKAPLDKQSEEKVSKNLQKKELAAKDKVRKTVKKKEKFSAEERVRRKKVTPPKKKKREKKARPLRARLLRGGVSAGVKAPAPAGKPKRKTRRKANDKLARSLLRKAIALKNRERFKPAERLLRKALALNPKDPVPYLSALGQILYELQKIGEAKRVLLRAYKLSPRRLKTGLVTLGAIFYEEGNQAKAFHYYKLYLKYYPKGKFAEDVRAMLQR